jgi:hypothetical protein
MAEPTPSSFEAESEQVSTEDRRKAVRFPCRPGAEVRFLVKPSFRSRRGFLKDVSTGGVALNVSQPIEEGAVLLIEMPAGPRGQTVLRVARVVGVRRSPVGYYLVSCAFTRQMGDRLIFGALQKGW